MEFRKENDIPEDFYSMDTNEPFKNCLVCNKDLIGSEEPYFIEKAVRNYKEYNTKDVIYEYAMCLQCAESMKNELSKESNEKIQEYFLTNINPQLLMELQHNDYQDRLSKCIITGEALNDQNEYMVCGMFKGDKLIQGELPYMLSEKAMDEIAQMMSNKTLGFLDDFMGEHFSGPPEINELFKPRRPVFI